jgi:hypothetical protein
MNQHKSALNIALSVGKTGLKNTLDNKSNADKISARMFVPQ